MPATKSRKLLIILAAIIGIVFAVEIALSFIITSVVRDVGIPQAEALLGVDVAFDRITASLFRSRAAIKGVDVGNPDNFSEKSSVTTKSMMLDVGIMSFLGEAFEISDVEVKDADLLVARNKDGEINSVKIYEHLCEVTSKDREKKPLEIPRLRLKRFAWRSLIKYVDHKMLENDVFELGWRFEAKAENLRTYGDSSSKWGTFSVKGHIDGDPDAFVLALRGKCAPLSDPLKTSFEVQGSITNIDMSRLGNLEEEIGLGSDSIELELNIKVREGAVVLGISEVTIRFYKPRLLGKLAKKLKNFPLPPVINVTVPFKGSLDNFKQDLVLAIVKSISGTAMDSVNRIIRNTDISPKGLENTIDGAVDSFSRAFGRKKKKNK